MSSSTPKGISTSEQRRRRRAAELLGDVLPGRSRDETDEGWNEQGGTSRDDEMRRDVPPHHG